MSQIKVTEFHTTYGQPVGASPNVLTVERQELRISLITEEVGELIEATGFNDLIEMADALGDIVYVCYGMAIEMGIDLDKVIAEIHRSNMSKLDESGNPIYREDGKVLKGPNYFKPDIASVVLF